MKSHYCIHYIYIPQNRANNRIIIEVSAHKQPTNNTIVTGYTTHLEKMGESKKLIKANKKVKRTDRSIDSMHLNVNSNYYKYKSSDVPHPIRQYECILVSVSFD